MLQFEKLGLSGRRTSEKLRTVFSVPDLAPVTRFLALRNAKMALGNSIFDPVTPFLAVRSFMSGDAGDVDDLVDTANGSQVCPGTLSRSIFKLIHYRISSLEVPGFRPKTQD